MKLFFLYGVLVLSVFLPFDSIAQVRSPEMAKASALSRQGRWHQAEKILTQIVKKEPRNSHAWFLLGFAYHSLERMKEAIAAYEKSVAISEHPDAIYNLAAAYARTGETEKALDWLEKFVSIRKITSHYLTKVDSDLRVLRKHPRFKKILEKTSVNDSPCMRIEGARQLDFWVGEWAVLDRKAGTV